MLIRTERVLQCKDLLPRVSSCGHLQQYGLLAGQDAGDDAFLPGDSPTEQPLGNRLHMEPKIISRQSQPSAGGMAAARLSQPEPSEACDMDDEADSEQQEQDSATAAADDSDDDRDVELVSADFNLTR